MEGYNKISVDSPLKGEVESNQKYSKLSQVLPQTEAILVFYLILPKSFQIKKSTIECWNDFTWPRQAKIMTSCDEKRNSGIRL